MTDGYNSKYTVSERQIASQIQKLRVRQRKLRKTWLEVDVKITALKHQLGGKYEGK